MFETEEKVLITFYTTTAALKMEKICHGKQRPGRLIPVPESVKAGCGLAWCIDCQTEEREKEQLSEWKQFMEEQDIYYEWMGKAMI